MLTLVGRIIVCGLLLWLPAAMAAGKVSVESLPMKPPIEDPSPGADWFKARFGLSWLELESTYSADDVDRFLKRWRKTYPSDPDAWLSSASWNARQSSDDTVELGTISIRTVPRKRRTQ